MVNGDCSTMKEGRERIRREGNDANVTYRSKGFLILQSSYSTVSIPKCNEVRRVRKVVVT